MTNTTVSPFVISQATEVELADDKGTKKRFWRKEILPSGTRKYGDTTLDFSVINPACVDAFNKGAFDAVSFVLPLADNKHPQPGEEVDTLEGNVHKIEMADGKLYGYFDFSTSPKVQGLIQKSGGKFGVSSRIEVNYTRKDVGETFPYALSHVCGTTRPHIKGMDPWESVELSDDEKADTTDLSDEVIDFSSDNKDGEKVTVEISSDELARIRKFMKDADDAETYAKTLSEGGKPNETGKPNEAESVELTEAKQQAAMAMRMAKESRIELAQSRWQTRRATLAGAGVPPVLLDLAEPVLSLPVRSTIELTDDAGAKTTVDASEVIEKLLDEAKGTIKLSQEDGHGFGGDGAPDDAAYKNFEAAILSDF